MAEQTLKNNPSLPTIAWKKYLETADYLIENPKGTKDGWDYKRVEAFLKFFAINSGIKPDFDLEKASLQEVVNFLRLHPDIFSETGEHLESLVPSLLLIKELLADWEEAKTKFEQERAVKKLTERLENISFGQKYQQIIQERLTQSVPPQLAEALAEELPLFPQPSLALKKLEELPEPQKEILMQQMTEEIQETVSVAIINLEKKKETSPKERETLSNIKVSVSDLPMLVSELGKPQEQREEFKKWVETNFSVEESQKIARILSPAVAVKIDLDRAGKEGIEEAVIVSLAENAPDLTVPPEKISRIISAFTPLNKEELKLWLAAKEVAPITLDEPREVTALPSRWLKITALPLHRSSPKDPLVVKDVKGKSFVEQLRQRIFTEGVNKSNALQLRSIVLESWVLYLTAQNISREDLEYTIQKLIKSGENPNSLRIKELREIREVLINFQNQLPSPLIEEIKRQSETLGKQGSLPIMIPSGQSTFILREESFNPKFNLKTRFQSFMGRVFGKREIILDFGPRIVINKFSFFSHRISEGSKNIFFQTGIGQNIGSWLKISTHRGLQGLWNLTQAGGKQIIGQGTKALFGTGVKTILKIAGNTALTVATGGLGKIFSLGSSLLKKGFGFLTSGLGVFSSFLGGVTGGSTNEDDKTLQRVLLAGMSIFIIVPILFFLNLSTNQAAFVEEGEIGPPGEDLLFRVTKTVAPNQIENSALPATLAYTIEIAAKDKKLSNLKLSEIFKNIKNGEIKNMTLSLSNPPPSTVSEILPNETKSFNFQAILNKGFEDSIIFNEITVEADIEDSSGPQKITTSASVAVGNALFCFAFEGPWSSNETSQELNAISKILENNKFANDLCKNPSQEIILVRELGDNWCTADTKIHITNKCIGTDALALYSLAHEAGHFYQKRNSNIYSDFLQKLYGNSYTPIEEPLCSYPLLGDLTRSQVPGEDFPETISVYLMNKYYPGYTYHNCGSTTINLLNDYQKHYNFIKDLF